MHLEDLKKIRSVLLKQIVFLVLEKYTYASRRSQENSISFIETNRFFSFWFLKSIRMHLEDLKKIRAVLLKQIVFLVLEKYTYASRRSQENSISFIETNRFFSFRKAYICI